MLRRRMLAICLLCFAALLVVPPVASAGTWRIKGRQGRVIGTATGTGTAGTLTGKYPVIRNRARVMVGGMLGYEHNSLQAWYAPPGSGGWVRGCLVQRVNVGGHWRWTITHEGEIGPHGRVLKRNGRWIVLEHRGDRWLKRGSAPGACLPWLAAGAVYVLNTTWVTDP